MHMSVLSYMSQIKSRNPNYHHLYQLVSLLCVATQLATYLAIMQFTSCYLVLCKWAVFPLYLCKEFHNFRH